MHQSALFLTLATVALGASTNADTTTATVNLLNHPALAARIADVNVQHYADTDSSIIQHPITVELGRRLDVNADLLKEDKPVDVKAMKRLNLEVGSTQEGHKSITVDINRRLLDVNADLLKEDKPVDINVAKRLDLNVGTASQAHKVIHVDINRRHLDVNAYLLKEDRPVDVNVAKRLDLNVGTTSQAHKVITVDINRRLDATTNTQTTATVNLARDRMPTTHEVSRRHLDINTLLAKEHKLIIVDLGKRLDLNIGTTVHTNTHADGEHKLITVDLGKRHQQMSTGYVLDITKVDANGQGTVVAKRDLNAKSEYQHLSARHKNDNNDDWEDNEEDEDEQTLNETESVVNNNNNNNKEAEKKKETSSSSDDKKKESSSSSTAGQKKNAASRANAITGLSIVGLVVGSALLWA
ncbi:hypothetical protein BGX30_000072 [Mortierella sp. GBA39]|nr:hypothetical protein BGX30_000072 [Mortierella sp. GBA39]